MSADDLLAWLIDHLPAGSGLIFDIGAGTGRDAAWFAEKGHEVVAIEPAGQMRRHGQQLHPNERIRWVDDRMPALATVLRHGLAADLILLSAVWQHLAPADRSRAFRKLVALLKPGDLLAITLRHGPAPPERGMHEVTLEEIERLARAHGLAVIHTAQVSDAMGRPQVSWTQVALIEIPSIDAWSAWYRRGSRNGRAIIQLLGMEQCRKRAHMKWLSFCGRQLGDGRVLLLR